MDNEQLIQWARDAGAQFDHMTWVERDLAPVFQRFAKLVATHERERFANECIDLVALYGGPVDLEAAIRARSNT